jgi:hypothetical protein
MWEIKNKCKILSLSSERDNLKTEDRWNDNIKKVIKK